MRKRRLDLGLVQRDLASRFHVSETTIGNWERGAEQPRIGRLADVIAFIGHDPEPRAAGLPGRLRSVRRRLGLTQAELALRLEQDENQICRWERGRRKPHARIANRIDLGLRMLEDGASTPGDEPPSFFDLTCWRRRLPSGMTVEPLSFGERLRARRLELGLSATFVARQSGTSRGTLYRIERGRQVPNLELQHRLRRILRFDASC